MKTNDIIPRAGKISRPKGEALGGPDKKQGGGLRDYLRKFAMLLMIFFIMWLGKELVFPSTRYLKVTEPDQVYTQKAIDEIRAEIKTDNKLYASNIVISLHPAPRLLTWVLIPEQKQEHTYRLWSVNYLEGIKKASKLERKEDSAWLDEPPTLTLEQGMAAMERMRPHLAEIRDAISPRIIARDNELNLNSIGRDTYGDAEGHGPIAPDAVTITLTGDKITTAGGIAETDMKDGTFYVYSRFWLDSNGNEEPRTGEPKPYNKKQPRGAELAAIVLLK